MPWPDSTPASRRWARVNRDRCRAGRWNGCSNWPDRPAPVKRQTRYRRRRPAGTSAIAPDRVDGARSCDAALWFSRAELGSRGSSGQLVLGQVVTAFEHDRVAELVRPISAAVRLGIDPAQDAFVVKGTQELVVARTRRVRT